MPDWRTSSQCVFAGTDSTVPRDDEDHSSASVCPALQCKKMMMWCRAFLVCCFTPRVHDKCGWHRPSNVDIMVLSCCDVCLGALRESPFFRSKASLELGGERHKSIWAEGGRHVLWCCKIALKVGWPGRISVEPLRFENPDYGHNSSFGQEHDVICIDRKFI